jgi:hypothetical protein
MRTINKIICKELTLGQDSYILGSARIKTDAVESKKNRLVLKMTAIIKLNAIYEDE